MKEIHLTEEQLQQFLVEADTKQLAGNTHLQHCPACKQKLEAYRLLFTSLAQQPAPAFDFDLATSVMASLQTEKSSNWETRFIYWLVAVTALLLTIPVYIFRKYFLTVVNGVVNMTLLIGVTGLVIVLVFQALELYRKYRINVDRLNYY